MEGRRGRRDKVLRLPLRGLSGRRGTRVTIRRGLGAWVAGRGGSSCRWPSNLLVGTRSLGLLLHGRLCCLGSHGLHFVPV